MTEIAASSSQRRNLNPNSTCTVNRLNRVQQQIQKQLVNLIAVVFNVWQIRVFLQSYRDWLGESTCWEASVTACCTVVFKLPGRTWVGVDGPFAAGR